MRHIHPDDPDLLEHFDRFAAFCKARMEHTGSGWHVRLKCGDGTAVEATHDRLLNAVAEVLNAAYAAGLDRRSSGQRSRAS
jgi:hypothetical protein